MLSNYGVACFGYRFSLSLGIALLIATGICYLPTGRAEDPAGQKASGPTPLMREGTRIVDRPAICRSSGERLVLTLDEDAPPMIALENLSAQRILKAVLDDATDDQWIVDGHVTEFQDHNFVLLERVVRQAKPK